MRKTFDFQYSIDRVLMQEIELNPNRRDVIERYLYGLREVFLTPWSRPRLLALLETYRPEVRKNRGRTGMDVWCILVLAGLKQTLDCSYDLLAFLANRAGVIRQMMGHADTDPTQSTRSRIHANVSALDPQLLVEVNQLVVKLGHRMVGQPQGEPLKCRCDSKPVKTNVHFPTDLSLLWDATRCTIRISAKVAEAFGLPGWRQHQSLKGTAYRWFQSSRKGRKRAYKLKKVDRYRKYCQWIADKARTLVDALQVLEQELLAGSKEDQARVQAIVEAKQELCRYLDYMTLFLDQIQRRIFDGEPIPSQEKVYSIFKPFTRWIVKGKPGIPCELSVPVAVIEDLHQFVLGYGILWDGTDKDIAVTLVELMEKQYPGLLMTCSFDRAFYNPQVRHQLDEKLVVTAMPKKGGLTKAERKRQNAPAYRKARKGHSAVESCLNHLNHRGLSLIREQGMDGFERVVATSVLAANLCRLGTLVRAKQRKRLRRLDKQRKRLRLAA
ncbi:MAG: ISNCY family transposase [Rhodothermaceae bacterium]|nr:ISNCY family transposase [Rhodothermaceae bacterium]MYE62360.1 ISNCY family transposase [Rhodothermaceae bacterium]MYJ19236.1 ISNCY family transposase [Rhodothermaceae bacterium]